MEAAHEPGPPADAGATVDLKTLEDSGVAGREAQPFRYRRPELKGTRGIAPLARSDILFSAVQVIRKGGENTLHSRSETAKARLRRAAWARKRPQAALDTPCSDRQACPRLRKRRSRGR